MKIPITVRAFVVLACFAAGAARAGEIKITYPSEGDHLPTVQKTFIFGNITPSTAPFYINDTRISVHKNGGFIAYLPVSEGDFAFNCKLLDGVPVEYTRRVKIRRTPALRSSSTLRVELVSPSEDVALSPGDFLNVQAEGTPGKTAVFSAHGLFRDAEMNELPAGSGRYYGVYRIKDSDDAGNAALSVRFKTGLFASAAHSTAKARVSVQRSPVIVETSTDTVILRNGVSSGYLMFLPKGVRLLSDGRAGKMRRIRLSPSETAWVDDSRVSVSTTAGFLPLNETGTIRIARTPSGVTASIYTYYPAPYIAEVGENSLRLTLYYVNEHTNWVVYDSSDTFIRQARVSQIGENTVAVDFEFTPGSELWGYDVYPGPRSMNVDFKKRPSVPGTWPKPLAGLRAVVDPGHSPRFSPPYDGAIGPMGSLEFQVNMETAYKLRDELTNLGATVFMTRTGDETVSLADRPKLAKSFNGDIFISLHNDAIPDGEDPFAQPKGFTIFYYHRHSLELGRAVHRSYVRNIPLPDRGLRFGDYAVTRMTSMPAILVESAYMIMPEQEELLNTPAFQQKLADTVTGGVLDLFKVQPPHGAKKRKK